MSSRLAAFAAGGCTSYIVGSPSSEFRFEVKRGDGEVRVFALRDVPEILKSNFQCQGCGPRTCAPLRRTCKC